jgi:PKD repeat protein
MYPAIAIVLVLLFSLTIQPALAGDTLTVTGKLIPAASLSADFSSNPTSGKLPLKVQFTDLSTGAITSWAWDFQNDGIVDSRAQNPVYTYFVPGTYSIRLRVSGPNGTDTEIKKGYITVTAPPRRPVARFTQDRYAGPVPLTVKFTDRSLFNPTNYLWRFGDGSTSTLKDPVHTYTRPGIYYVEHQVSNEAGSSRTWGIAIALRNGR